MIKNKILIDKIKKDHTRYDDVRSDGMGQDKIRQNALHNLTSSNSLLSTLPSRDGAPSSQRDILYCAGEGSENYRSSKADLQQLTYSTVEMMKI